MRDETKRQLERQLWLRRLRWVGIGAALAAGVALLAVFANLDATVTNQRLPGTITAVNPIAGKEASRGYTVDVRLDGSGKTVHVLVLKTSDPHVGDHVEVTEHTHATGRVNYTWK